MNAREKVDRTALFLPDALTAWLAGAALYESSGQSGARTVYIDRGDGAYLKIADRGSLHRSARMQAHFAAKGMAPAVLFYLSADRDYMITRASRGEDGTSERYLSNSERLSEVFGHALRRLHETDTADCPEQDKMAELVSLARTAAFRQSHLDDIAQYIGAACAEHVAAEIAATSGLLKNDALIHGDYCLPNILLNDWEFESFIDVADGGVGDRHYDLVWGLWTLNWNLKSSKHGRRFLDAYGRDLIDKGRLRVCGLLAALE